MLRGYMGGYIDFAYLGMLLEHDIRFKKTKNISNVERVYGWGIMNFPTLKVSMYMIYMKPSYTFLSIAYLSFLECFLQTPFYFEALQQSLGVHLHILV